MADQSKYCGKHDVTFTTTCWCCDKDKAEAKASNTDPIEADIEQLREDYRKAFDAVHQD